MRLRTGVELRATKDRRDRSSPPRCAFWISMSTRRRKPSPSTIQPPPLDGGLTSGFSPTRIYAVRNGPDPRAIASPDLEAPESADKPECPQPGLRRIAFLSMQMSVTCARDRTV